MKAARRDQERSGEGERVAAWMIWMIRTVLQGKAWEQSDRCRRPRRRWSLLARPGSRIPAGSRCRTLRRVMRMCRQGSRRSLMSQRWSFVGDGSGVS